MIVARLKMTDSKLAAWLTSNPVADRYAKDVPIVLVLTDDCMFRWPVVEGAEDFS